MFTKRLSMVIAAGILVFGIAALAQAEDKGKTIRSQEQVRITEQNEAQVKTGGRAENAAGDQTMTQDRTQSRDRLKDGTGDHDPDRLRDRDQDRDRIHDHLGMGSAGMGGGMRGPRR